MSSVDPSTLRQVQTNLHRAGLDLSGFFSVARANVLLPDEYQLPQFDRPDCAGLILGNTKALWPAWRRFSKSRGHAQPPETDPLDTYVTDRVTEALQLCSVRHWVGYSHHTDPQPLPMQRIADAAGLLHLGPAHLSVHAKFGPWCALRAVVCWDAPAVIRSFEQPAKASCAGCAAPCLQALEAALRGPSRDAPAAAETVEVSAERVPWLRVRDACPLGRAHRYERAQLRYHYDKILTEER